MPRSLSIQNFRQFSQLQIEPLQQINLIVSKNNAGKTAVLEALALLFLVSSSEQEVEKFPARFRRDHGSPEDDFDNFWLWLPYQHNLATPPTDYPSQAGVR
jgi:AAA15 family ATPase/GTPase